MSRPWRGASIAIARTTQAPAASFAILEDSADQGLPPERYGQIVSLLKRPGVVQPEDIAKKLARRIYAQEPLAQPLGKVRANEFVVLQVGIEFAYTIDLFGLTGGKLFVLVKAPAAFQQALPA